MATNRSIIYCYVEGRGSGLKGKDSLFSINNRLGTYEIEDVINVTRYVYTFRKVRSIDTYEVLVAISYYVPITIFI